MKKINLCLVGAPDFISSIKKMVDHRDDISLNQLVVYHDAEIDIIKKSRNINS
jgi:hypothetical protein